MSNRQKYRMIRQRLLTVILMCMFCLFVSPVQAADNPIEKKFKAYPNPVDRGALMTIELPDDCDEITVLLVNIVGKVVQTYKTTNKTIEINVPDLSGIYLLRFVDTQKVIAVEKIVVKE